MRVLVPIDGSTDCQAAHHVAFQLAEALPDAVLHALHIVNVREASGNLLEDAAGYVGFEPAIANAAVVEAHHQAGRALLDAFTNRAITLGVNATSELATGAVTETLVKAANTADVVVMGLRGESHDRFPGQGGAQTANAVPQLDIPVLLVPRQVTRIRSIAVGYDGSAAAQRALRSVRALAGPLGTPVHLLHVGGDADEARDRFTEAEAALDDDVPVVRHHVPLEGSVHQTLVETTREAQADLLVLGFRGRSTLKDVVFGSARAHLLASDLPVAILVAH
jgi:nucleotide-binding universal stress UspA family protein